MADCAYAVVLIDGQKKSSCRALGFLSCVADRRVNAGATFRSLKGKRERELRSRFDYWIDGGTKDNYFHGWPNEEKYKSCFVFKWKENRQRHRLYGFRCHPLRNSNPQFQLCVLVLHAAKNERETDLNELDYVNMLRTDPAVIAAIRSTFPDRETRTRQWVN